MTMHCSVCENFMKHQNCLHINEGKREDQLGWCKHDTSNNIVMDCHLLCDQCDDECVFRKTKKEEVTVADPFGDF